VIAAAMRGSVARSEDEACFLISACSSPRRTRVAASANRRKHGVSFVDAQLVCLDPHRVIARDVVHSVTEEQHCCIGAVGKRIMTVRFIWQDGLIRIIGAGYWRVVRELYEARSQGD
jgi:uncharacterized DUF497 family protein